MNKTSIRLGLSEAFTCAYLSEQQEQLAYAILDDDAKHQLYPTLLQNGFRRSGQEVYRPHCPNCNQCHSLRIDALAFNPTKSQQRQLKHLARFKMSSSNALCDDDYPLYARYITARHQDGSMYPPSEDGFISFLGRTWQNALYIRLHDEEHLVAVAVCDLLPDGLSAVYTFFEPSLNKYSLGKLSILSQLQWLKQEKLTWLYLGYQIDACQKMNYKAQFSPHQRFIGQQWQEINE